MKTGTYLALVVGTIVVGLTFEASLPAKGQLAANVLTFIVFGFVLSTSTKMEARALWVCTALALAGEILLCFGWGLYTYRQGNLPMFVPPGHALLFFAGLKASRELPDWFPWAVASASLPVVGVVVFGYGYTAELLWFGLFLIALCVGKERKVYSVMLLMALGLELLGTYLGAWRWAPEIGDLGLRSMNPPLTAGAFYCILDYLVLISVRRLFGAESP